MKLRKENAEIEKKWNMFPNWNPHVPFLEEIHKRDKREFAEQQNQKKLISRRLESIYIRRVMCNLLLNKISIIEWGFAHKSCYMDLWGWDQDYTLIGF